jgi:hypothetical protein
MEEVGFELRLKRSMCNIIYGKMTAVISIQNTGGFELIEFI